METYINGKEKCVCAGEQRQQQQKGGGEGRKQGRNAKIKITKCPTMSIYNKYINTQKERDGKVRCVQCGVAMSTGLLHGDKSHPVLQKCSEKRREKEVEYKA